MKKKVVLLAMVLLMMLQLLACSPKNCKADDCSNEVYKSGLCESHYFEKALEEGLKELGDMFDY